MNRTGTWQEGRLLRGEGRSSSSSRSCRFEVVVGRLNLVLPVDVVLHDVQPMPLLVDCCSCRFDQGG
jgi:hypothetical protein